MTITPPDALVIGAFVLLFILGAIRFTRTPGRRWRWLTNPATSTAHPISHPTLPGDGSGQLYRLEPAFSDDGWPYLLVSTVNGRSYVRIVTIMGPNILIKPGAPLLSVASVDHGSALSQLGYVTVTPGGAS